MTPPHDTGTDTGDNDERFAHFFRCWDRPGGPGYELRDQVDTMHSGFIDMTATIRTWGRAIAGAVTLLTLAVAMLGYLQMREKDRTPRLVPQAHAETKGSP